MLSARQTTFNIVMLISFIVCFTDISFSKERIRIAVSDFIVQSENQQFKYLGKGFAEFIGIDILKSPNVDLIDREKRIEVIKEQELSMTGLIEEKDQVKLGKILAANYIITGNIFDIAGSLSVTFKVIDTSDAKVVMQGKITGSLSNYDYLSAQISQKILTQFALAIPDEIIAKADKLVEKQADTAVNFSNAVNAFDKNDLALAKAELEKAKTLDPENDAVNTYLQKLVVNTAKFKTITEMHYPNQNPAYLGIIKFDRLFFYSAFLNAQPFFKEKRTTINESYDVDLMEQSVRFNLGYQFPVEDSYGIGIEAFFGFDKDGLYQKGNNKYGDKLWTSSGNIGINLSLGRVVSDYFSIGAGAAFYEQIRETVYPDNGNFTTGHTVYDKYYDFRIAGFAGFLIKDRNSTLIFDSMGGYSNEKQFTLDPVKHKVADEVKAPIYNENTFTKAFLGKRIFLVLKEVNNFYTDRDYLVIRAISALEVWPFTWLSLRGGYEYSHVKMEDTSKTGSGFTGGLSLRSISKGFDFDLNYTKRNRPSRILKGETIDESIIYFTVSKTNLFISR